MKTQEMIDVLKAYQEGKTIQYVDDDSEWVDIDNPSWDFYSTNYRVKPEIKPRRFILIKEFPLSPSLGTIVEFKTEQDFNDGIHAVGAISTLILSDCINYPEFWKELKEEGVSFYNADLVGKTCKNKMGVNMLIIGQTNDIITLKYFPDTIFSISYETSNNYYTLC